MDRPSSRTSCVRVARACDPRARSSSDVPRRIPTPPSRTDSATTPLGFPRLLKKIRAQTPCVTQSVQVGVSTRQKIETSRPYDDPPPSASERSRRVGDTQLASGFFSRLRAHCGKRFFPAQMFADVTSEPRRQPSGGKIFEFPGMSDERVRCCSCCPATRSNPWWCYVAACVVDGDPAPSLYPRDRHTPRVRIRLAPRRG